MAVKVHTVPAHEDNGITSSLNNSHIAMLVECHFHYIII